MSLSLRPVVTVGTETDLEWTSLSLVRDLTAAAGVLTITGLVRQGQRMLYVPGAVVSITLAGVQNGFIFAGTVDGFTASDGIDGATFTAKCRDFTGDLVDCPPRGIPIEFRGLKLLEIARRIAAPFDVAVSGQGIGAEGPLVPLFARDSSETAYSSIERLARRYGFLVYTEGDAGLIVAQPGARFLEQRLIRGTERGTVMEASLQYSHAKRFSTYFVLGQRGGSEEEFGAVVSEVLGQADDPEISRFRPLEVIAEGPVSKATATERAQYEATFREADSSTVSVRVFGWLHGDAELWRPNTTVRTTLPNLRVDKRLLVKQVRLDWDPSDGETATLKLVRRNAYTLNPSLAVEENPMDGWLE